MAAWYANALKGLEDAFNSGDFSRVADWLADDAEFDWSRSISDNRGIYRGRESMRAGFDDFIATWEQVRWEITDVRELGPTRVLASGKVIARVRGTENEIEASGAYLLDFRDGKILKAALFQDRNGALEAAGAPLEQ